MRKLFIWIPAFAGMTRMLFVGMTRMLFAGMTMLFAGMTLLAGTAWANLITVSNVSITSQNETNKTADVQFNITWQNSWSNAVNHDAAWVFIKYSTDGGVTWAHATLAAPTGGSATSGTGGIKVAPSSTSNYSVGSGTALDIIVPTEATSGYEGAFLRRDANGSGTVTTTGVQFVWNWGVDYLSNAPSTPITASTTARVQVFAIEMVYVPIGSFYLGDGTSTSVTGQFCTGTTTSSPFLVSSQAAMTLGGGGSNLGNNNTSGMAPADDWNNSTTKSLLSSFPEGYNAYYMMKYDVSQGQWRDFLNTLTRTQQNNRVYDAPTDDGVNLSGLSSLPSDTFVMSNTSSVLDRNGIQVTSIPSSTAAAVFGCNLNGTVNWSNDGEWVAMNYLSWMDGAAYAAWAGLRPFTEFEYEKASRGPSSVDTGTANEYAWGNTTIVATTGVSNGGTNAEVSSTSGANCTYNDSYNGPTRVGMYATSSSSQTQAGASYYGMMDLSGNVWERPVTVGNSTGRAFIGSNGTGTLATDGNVNCATNNTDWPGCSSGEITGATGCGFRGGTWTYGSTYERVSDRYNAAYPIPNRTSVSGARFARTAP